MTESMEKKLEDRFVLTVNGDRREVFMSAGLLRRCVTEMMSKASSDLTELYINPEAQNGLMVLCLVEKDKRGRAAEASIDDFEFSEEEGDLFLAWVTEHVLSFFVRNAQRMGNQLQDPKSALSKLTRSTAGTEDSPLMNQSAGDTAAA